MPKGSGRIFISIGVSKSTGGLMNFPVQSLRQNQWSI